MRDESDRHGPAAPSDANETRAFPAPVEPPASAT